MNRWIGSGRLAPASSCVSVTGRFWTRITSARQRDFDQTDAGRGSRKCLVELALGTDDGVLPCIRLGERAEIDRLRRVEDAIESRRRCCGRDFETVEDGSAAVVSDDDLQVRTGLPHSEQQ